MRTLNLGILAHVDAGKTTLTERLLYTAGAISKIGTVDAGTTQTDTLELERERGITIKSAVASFAIDDLTVNILDTPGHPDFIAEVERVLRVLDGAILVISAVEGVQPQTPLLFRALQRLRVPTLLFLNKIDRRGADPARVLESIAARLTPAVVPMGAAFELGTPRARFRLAGPDDPDHRERLAESLAERDEGLLEAFVGDGAIPYPRLRRALADQTKAGQLHPLFLGAAATGTGVAEILAALPELLPEARGDAAAPIAGRVFKIDRSSSGERVAYARLLDGTVHARERLVYGQGLEGRVTSLSVFGPAGPAQAQKASAGQIARLGGLAGIRVGDPIGSPTFTDEERQFPPPSLESVVRAVRAADRGRVRAALNELAEQDPLIDVRQDDERTEIAVSLYGEVQKEVIGETLARDYGVEVSFASTTTICIERPIGTGEALAVISAPTHSNISGKSSPDSDNPFAATLGLRIEPGKVGSGLVVEVDVDVKLIPMQIFNTVAQFRAQMTRIVAEALEEGVHGWHVTDCIVTLFDSGYIRTGSTTSDFRRLTPLVLATAIREAGVVVCEPMASIRVDAPVDSGRGIAGVVVSAGGRILGQHSVEARTTIVALLQAGRVHEVQNRIPGLTGGEGVFESSFAGYHPVQTEPPPSRRRTRPNPFNRTTYLAALSRHG
ncbi:MAG TPA: translation factor GTPase family protein [Candidatus Limnocylindrales bacterium]|nr:translation factor GTPase family protein [Candidatus Limnocylindrales bacterium]